MDEIRLADICSQLASMLTGCGAEIYRVEDTVRRICCAYGHGEAEISATPAYFMLTLKKADDTPVTQSASIPARSTNLDRVGRINELSRYICARKPDADVICAHIKSIRERKIYSAPVQYLSFLIAGAAFTAASGGLLKETVFGGLLAMLIRFVEGRLRSVKASSFLLAVVCSMCVSVAAAFLYRLGAVDAYDHMIIGATMMLVPGVAMTNGMRDFISGDLFSGIYTITEALLTAIGLALGAGSAVAAIVGL